MDDLNALLSQLDNSIDLDPFHQTISTFHIPTESEVALQLASAPKATQHVVNPFGENPFVDDPIETGLTTDKPIVTVVRDPAAEKRRAAEAARNAQAVEIDVLYDPKEARRLKEEELRNTQDEVERERIRLELLELAKSDVPEDAYKRRKYDIESVRPPVAPASPPRPEALPPGSPVKSCNVVYPDGQRKSVSYVDAFSGDQLLKSAAALVGVWQYQFFALSVVENGVEFAVHPHQTVEWIQAGQQITFGVRLFKMPRHLADVEAARVLFQIVKSKVVNRTYTVKLAVAIRLAAIQLEVEHGSFAEVVRKNVQPRVREMLPPSDLEEAYLKERVLYQLAKRPPPGSVIESILDYIAIARSSPEYGITYFTLRGQDGSPVQFGVAEEGLLMPAGGGKVAPFGWDRIHHWAQPAEDTLEIYSQKNPEKPFPLKGDKNVIFNALDLITVYYCLAADLSEAVPWTVLPFQPDNLPDSSLFRIPGGRVMYDLNQPSRIDFFRFHYIRACKEDNIVPHRRVVYDLVDKSIDDEVLIRELDFSSMQMTGAVLTTIVRALRNTFSENIDGYENFEENFSTETINLSHNKLDNKAIGAVCDLMDMENPFVVHNLVLDYNDIGAKGCKDLGACLAKYTVLKDLSMCGCPIKDGGFTALVDTMKYNGALISYRFANCKITDGSHKILGNMIAKNAHLRTYDLSGNRLGEMGGKWFSAGLKQNSVLRTVQLNGVGWGNNFCKKICSWASKQNQLTRLEMAGNDIGSNGAVLLAKYCESAPKLFFVNVSNGTLGTMGVSQFAQSIGLSKSLREVDISRNNFSGKDGDVLAESIEKNPAVWRYNIAECRLSKDSLKAIAGHVESSRTIRSVDISGNKLDGEVLDAWVKCIRQSRLLTEIGLGDCVKEEQLDVLFDAIKASPSLRTVRLSGMKLKSSLGGSIASFIKDPTMHVEELYLEDCNINNQSFTDLLNAVQGTMNPFIRLIHVDNNQVNAAKADFTALLDALHIRFTGIENEPDPHNFENWGNPIEIDSSVPAGSGGSASAS
jgi:Ran GTPase-activating protein (RanGAP) involved in mRNA processing and transport